MSTKRNEFSCISNEITYKNCALKKIDHLLIESKLDRAIEITKIFLFAYLLI